MSPGTPKEALDENEFAWMTDANCLGVDLDLFFPGSGKHTTDAAKKVCAGCKVRRECLTYSLEHGEAYGVWGGHSEQERRRLRRWWRPGMALPPIKFGYYKPGRDGAA